ncbi:PepSY domain-containing protein [Thiohalorhabdus sp.]|uniref:PepSY domain-containing protein n=1 Tax=Thiohalorhabdus sp. TaxID=3094134 RepID=UPI002FC2E873
MNRGLVGVLIYTVGIGAPTGITVAPEPAQADEDLPPIRQLHRQGEIRSLAAFVERARQRYPEARLIEAELLRDGGRLIYEVELVDSDGVVRELFFDARTGERVTGYDEESQDH